MRRATARRTVAVLSLIGAGLAGTVRLAQSQTKTDGRPEFEVASIKLDKRCDNQRPGESGPPVQSPGKLQMNCTTLEGLIQTSFVSFANGVSLSRQKLEITGGPGWVRSDQYDVVAKADGNAHVPQMAGPMLQRLLEDRFQLKLHRERKEGAVYALTPAKSGLKLKLATEGGCVAKDLDHWPPPTVPGQARPNFCGDMMLEGKGMTTRLEGHGMTMAEFIHFLSLFSLVDRPVVDRTGFTGLFDFQMEFGGAELIGGLGGGGVGRSGGKMGSGNPPAQLEPSGPSGPVALEEQLGLKLAPTKGPVEFLVIDRAARPSDN